MTLFTIHTLPHPSLLLLCICCHTFIAEGEMASPLWGDPRTATAILTPSPHRPLLPHRQLNTSYANCRLHDRRVSICRHPSDPRCCHYRAIVIIALSQRGSSAALGGHWLMTMERRAAKNNADNDDRSLLLCHRLHRP